MRQLRCDSRGGSSPSRDPPEVVDPWSLKGSVLPTSEAGVCSSGCKEAAASRARFLSCIICSRLGCCLDPCRSTPRVLRRCLLRLFIDGFQSLSCCVMGSVPSICSSIHDQAPAGVSKKCAFPLYTTHSFAGKRSEYLSPKSLSFFLTIRKVERWCCTARV